MSFEVTKQGFFWTCNRCGLVAEFPPLSFWRALDELKARGWEIIRLDDVEGGRLGASLRALSKEFGGIVEYAGNQKGEASLTRQWWRK